MAAKQLSDKNSDGVVLGQSGDKVGFFGKAPTTQIAATTAPAATAATSTTPFGYSQAQADALIVWARAIDAELKAKGLIAS